MTQKLDEVFAAFEAQMSELTARALDERDRLVQGRGVISQSEEQPPAEQPQLLVVDLEGAGHQAVVESPDAGNHEDHENTRLSAAAG